MYLHIRARGALLLALFVLTSTARALVIEDDFGTAPRTVPGVSNTYPWTAVVFGSTSMSASGGVLAMVTAPNEGIYFGKGIGTGPGWALGSVTSGTYISLDMRLSAGSKDWSLYFYDNDGQHSAAWLWNPAGGYADPLNAGFEYYHDDGNGDSISTFVPFDLADGAFHTFEILLKDHLVHYAVDGRLLYSGAAAAAGTANLLVIGDGSGSTPTGTGAMFVDHVFIDTAPTMNALAATPVPLPPALALLAVPLGLALQSRRRA